MPQNIGSGNRLVSSGITWATNDPHLYHHMKSSSHSKLISTSTRPIGCNTAMNNPWSIIDKGNNKRPDEVVHACVGHRKFMAVLSRTRRIHAPIGIQTSRYVVQCVLTLTSKHFSKFLLWFMLLRQCSQLPSRSHSLCECWYVIFPPMLACQPRETGRLELFHCGCCRVDPRGLWTATPPIARIGFWHNGDRNISGY